MEHSNDNALYFLEHIFLPALIYPEKDNSQMTPFMLGNVFPGLCAKVMADLKQEGQTDKTYTAKEFSAVPLEIRDEHDGRLHFYVLQLTFPFAETPLFSNLCPRAFLVHGPKGEDPHYYTVEYDISTQKYMLCSWLVGMHHENYGFIASDPKTQLQEVLHKEKQRTKTDGHAHIH